MKDPKDWNILEMVQAVIDDDPEAETIRESLTQALKETQAGEFARTTYLSETRHSTGLTQQENDSIANVKS